MVDSQIVKNIIQALKSKGIANSSSLAKSVKYDLGNMSKLMNDKIKMPASLRESLQAKYGISHNYLVTGEGEMFDKVKTTTESDIKHETTNPNALQDAKLLCIIDELKHENEVFKLEIAVLKKWNAKIAESNLKLIDLLSKTK